MHSRNHPKLEPSPDGHDDPTAIDDALVPEISVEQGRHVASAAAQLDIFPPATLTPAATLRDGWQPAINAFLETAAGRGGRPLAAPTRRAYYADLQRFAAFALDRGLQQPDRLTVAHLVAYRRDLFPEPEAPPRASQARAVNAVRRFVRWLRALDPALPSSDEIREAFPSCQAPSRPHPGIAPAERRRLVHDVRQGQRKGGLEGNEEVNARDAAILALVLGLGLRRSEAAAVQLEDLVEDAGGQRVLDVLGKGNRRRTLPVPDDITGIFERYLELSSRTWTSPGALLVGCGPRNRGWGITARTVYNRVRAMVKAAGVTSKVSPHGLRGTFARRALEAGMDIATLGRVLGHADRTVTLRYLDQLQTADLADSMPGFE
ncbi:MAG: tyrosine-type recombinase/integrase [Acidobacteriota bacterium]